MGDRYRDVLFKVCRVCVQNLFSKNWQLRFLKPSQYLAVLLSFNLSKAFEFQYPAATEDNVFGAKIHIELIRISVSIVKISVLNFDINWNRGFEF